MTPFSLLFLFQQEGTTMVGCQGSRELDSTFPLLRMGRPNRLFYSSAKSTFVPRVPLVLMESTLGFLQYKMTNERLPVNGN